MNIFVKATIFLSTILMLTFALVSKSASASSKEEKLEPRTDCYVMVSPADEKSTASDAMPECLDNSAMRSSPTITGIDYTDSFYGGSSLNLTTSDPNGCNNGSSYQLGHMPAGWDNVVSSAKGYAGCDSFFHYQHNGHIGIFIECSPNCSTMSLMDDETSSLRMAP